MIPQKTMISIEKIIEDINKISKSIDRQINLMEVCGTHTQVISRYGIADILPKNIHLSTGPGCPVCVTSQIDIDAIVSLALAGIPIATYGDVLRVPGAFGSLDQAREQGAKVFVVHTTEDALQLKEKHPDVVFFGLGFETTAPMTAYAIQNGLTVYSAHKLFLPAMLALVDMKELNIDGFIDPGHVSAIIGTNPYQVMKLPQVITGFEAEDVIVGIYMLLKQISDGRAEVENQYVRIVRKEGNPKARKLIKEVFDVTDGHWRGFDTIAVSGLEIKDKYKEQNAKIKYKEILDKVDFSQSKKPTACKCGEIIRGMMRAKECPLFGKVCTPDNPVGPCMVSVEGACNVAYERKDNIF
ncbi:MAG: hydrogenase formation protein HypD [Patescibacteria group bacterium]|nr:hydrogenase formation protein HypD [Patescibacteria group bacterium]